MAWVTYEAMYRLGAQPGETRGDWVARTGAAPDIRISDRVLREHVRMREA